MQKIITIGGEEDKNMLDNEDVKAEERLRLIIVIISLISDKINIHANIIQNKCRKLIEMIMTTTKS